MPTLRGASGGGTGATAAATATFTIPSGTVANDVLNIWCFAGTTVVTTWSATGWTAQTPTAGTNGQAQLLTLVATGSMSGTVTVTCSGTINWAGVICGYSAGNATTPFDPAPAASGQVNTSSTTLA